MSDSLKFYTHRERGHIFINFFEGMEKGEAEEFLKDISIHKFGFRVSTRQTEGSWGSIISVFWNGQRFGGINLRTGKFFADTKQGLKRGIDEFVSQLGRFISLDVSKIYYDYVEICGRFPREHFEKAVGIMREFKEKFRTIETEFHQEEHDSIKGIALCLANNVLFSNHELNLKAYRFFEYDKTKKYNFKRIEGESLLRNPKFEIQIDNPETLENALKEVIPVMIAFFKGLNCKPVAMEEKDEIGDYQLVEWAEELGKDGQKINDYLSRGNRIYITRLHGLGLSLKIEERRNMILKIIAEKPLCLREIGKKVNACANTISTDLDWLGEKRLVEVRGRCGLRRYYAAT